mmetsp:Transcript_22171/g.69149  ORF Transcript_22171/g.69149 Transcript_22171/m.69149 type:complete len:909 (-) Transcript_22171:215-2941(-)
MAEGAGHATVTTTLLSRKGIAPWYLSGASLTLAATTFVCATYIAFPKLRKHPAPLLWWMSVCDFVFGLAFFVEYAVDRSVCHVLSPVTQVSVFASELFFCMHAVDLVYGLTHPFTLDSQNMRKYHVVVWLCSITTAVLIPSNRLAGSVGTGFCWIRDGLLNWTIGLIAAPLVAIYVFSIAVLVWAARRLRTGMPATFATRLRVLYKLRTTVAVYTLYMLALLVALVSGALQEQTGRDSTAAGAVAALVISARGVANALVWVATRDVLRHVRALRLRKGRQSETSVTSPPRSLTRGDTRGSFVDINGVPHVDPHSSINYALRTELLQATSEGIVEAVRRAAELYDTHHEHHPGDEVRTTVYGRTKAWLWDGLPAAAQGAGAGGLFGGADGAGGLGGLFVAPTGDHAPSEASVPQPLAHEPAEYDLVEQHVRGVTDFSNEVTFHDYAPRIFHNLRRRFNIDEDEYCRELSGARRERFSEGKSGAFLYFSETGRYIVKTTSKSEARDLVRLLPAYHQHFLQHPDSLLLRYVGLHAITLYGQKMHFVVMESVFASHLKIHERYDLKGSWVGRRAHKLVDKRRGVRRVQNSEWPQFTGARFAPGFSEVRKDLDLHRPLILNPADAHHLASQMKVDARFLERHRIMDYSLLLGIHNQHFRVKARHDEEDPLGVPAAGAADLPKPIARRGTMVGIRKASTPGPGALVNLPANAPPHRAHKGGIRAVVVEGPGVYFMGIIDILQTYTLRKRLEYWTKRFLLCSGLGISAVPPELYARRFISNVVETFIEPPPEEEEDAEAGQARPAATGGNDSLGRREPSSSFGHNMAVAPGVQLNGASAASMRKLPEVEPATPGYADNYASQRPGGRGGAKAAYEPVRTEQRPWLQEVLSWFQSEPPEVETTRGRATTMTTTRAV